jgi:hypothetical protein
MLGAMAAAVRARIPIIAEGPQGLAAVRALAAIRPDLRGQVFICGVADAVEGLYVFADADESETGYAAAALAALFQNEYAKAQKVA